MANKKFLLQWRTIIFEKIIEHSASVDLNMQLSVIIVNYNVKHFLEQCLCSVQKAIAGMQAEIIVIDNNSADNSIDYLTAKFPGSSVYCQ